MADRVPLIYENVFGVSETRGITAQKRPVHIGISLWNEDRTRRIEETTVYTGTKITIVVTLHEVVNGGYVCKNPDYYPESTANQPIDIYHRLEGGTWRKIATVTTDRSCGAECKYTLMGVGRHEFYAEYKGNEYLEGCKSKVAKSFAR